MPGWGLPCLIGSPEGCRSSELKDLLVGACTLFVQVKETRWNVSFSADFSSVEYYSLNAQSYVPEASCTGCSLTNDYLITINRYYNQPGVLSVCRC